MACRSLAKAEDAVARILSETSVIGTLIPAECDLASIQSIQSFAKNISVEQIDTLCLNAGIARSTEAKDCENHKHYWRIVLSVRDILSH